MPCLFNRWHDSQFDYGGTYIENIRPGWRHPLDYVKALVTPLAADDRILAWDLCNEPQAADLNSEPNKREFQWLSEVAATVRGCGARQPVLIGTMQGTEHVRTYAPLVDVLCAHPYAHDRKGLADRIEAYRKLCQETGKPLLVNETIPGCLDDAKRAEVVKFYARACSAKPASAGWAGSSAKGWPFRPAAIVMTATASAVRASIPSSRRKASCAAASNSSPKNLNFAPVGESLNQQRNKHEYIHRSRHTTPRTANRRGRNIDIRLEPHRRGTGTGVCAGQAIAHPGILLGPWIQLPAELGQPRHHDLERFP